MASDTVGNLIIVAVSLGAAYLVMALGLTLVYGVARIFNFAQGSFLTWGAYLAWVLYTNFNLPQALVWIIVGVTMFWAGFAFEKTIISPLRQKVEDLGFTPVVVTIGFALATDSLALAVFGGRYKMLPRLFEGVFDVGGFLIGKHDLATLIIAMAIVICLELFLRKTTMGMAMRAVAQDVVGANIVGIEANKVYSYIFAIAGVLAAISGLLVVPRISLHPAVGLNLLFKTFVIVVAGGLGSIRGTIYAAFILAFVETFASFYLGAIWGLSVFFLVLIAILIIRPRGLLGIWG